MIMEDERHPTISGENLCQIRNHEKLVTVNLNQSEAHVTNNAQLKVCDESEPPGTSHCVTEKNTFLRTGAESVEDSDIAVYKNIVNSICRRKRLIARSLNKLKYDCNMTESSLQAVQN